MIKIIRKEKIVLCSGFYASYNINAEQVLCNIECESVLNIDEWKELEHPYQQLSIFLKGSCQLFALALNKKYGYPVYEITQMDRVIHCFCIKEYNHQKMYIDIRGATSDFEEFMLGVNMIEGKEYSLRLRRSQEDETLNGEWDDIGYALAQATIEKFSEYYEL